MSLPKLLVLLVNLVLLVGALGNVVSVSNPPNNQTSDPGTSGSNQIPTPTQSEIRKHFKDFSYNLLLQSDLDEFSVEKGAAISSPFGVGYMLANINEKVWNVSNEGVDYVLNSPDGKIAENYQALIDTLHKGKMSISSTLFTRDQNVSSKFTEGSRKMKTDTKYVDFIDDWKTTWITMNNKIANQTNGILDDQLIPKGGWWGGAFYYFTMGAFINTNHYKGSWSGSWSDIGMKPFHDGLRVPFYESGATLPTLDTENYTAVAISLKDGKKTVVFALPKVPFVDFLKSDMAQLVRNGAPQLWNSQTRMKIQIPALNITLLDQHYKKLEALGVNYTFCVDEPDSLDVALKKGPYFMGPIVQSHHIQVTPEYFEVATATGSSTNSEEKMREEGQFPSGPSGPSQGSEEAGTELFSEGSDSEFVLPIDLDPKLVKSLADGEVQVKKVDVLVSDDTTHKNDTLTIAASSVEEVVVPAPTGANGSFVYPVTVNSVTTVPTVEEVKVQPEVVTSVPTSATSTAATTTTTATPTPTTTGAPVAPPTPVPVVEEVLPENTIRFDKPFFWYLYDDDMGPLYYGTVHSLATYQKEYELESDEDLWLYDAYKTLLWNCP